MPAILVAAVPAALAAFRWQAERAVARSGGLIPEALFRAEVRAADAMVERAASRPSEIFALGVARDDAELLTDLASAAGWGARSSLIALSAVRALLNSPEPSGAARGSAAGAQGRASCVYVFVALPAALAAALRQVASYAFPPASEARDAPRGAGVQPLLHAALRADLTRYYAAAELLAQGQLGNPRRDAWGRFSDKRTRVALSALLRRAR